MSVDKVKLSGGKLIFLSGDQEINHITTNIDGDLNINFSKIINVDDPVNLTDVVNKKYTDLHIDNYNNPHHVTKEQIGLLNVENIKNNFNAIISPNDLNDDADGYSIGSRWINNTTHEEWICFDVTEGSALWKNITNSLTDLNILNEINNHINDHTIHHIINDNNISTTELWSSYKINNELLHKSDINHTHLANDIINIDQYIADHSVNTQQIINVINSQKWIHDGIASLDSNSKIPITQLPPAIFPNIYVLDDVMQMNALYYAKKGDLAKVNNINNKGVLFIHTGSGWLQLVISDDFLTDVNSVNGKTGYVQLTTSDIPESTNLYFTDYRVATHTDVYSSTQHRQDTNNPHNVTKTQLGLSNVENIKNNFVANNDPVNISDIIAGYNIGSHWINNVTNKEFVCVQNTEMHAIWTETTQPGGEFNTVSNLGDGVGLYSTKIDSDLKFKSLIGGNNVNLTNNTNDITINSVNTRSFILTTIPMAAITTTYSSVLYFPWNNSQFSTFSNGTLVFETEIFDRNIDVQVIDLTHNVVLGSQTNIALSGVYTFSVANPSDDCRIAIQIEKTSNGGTDPMIYGMILNYMS